MPPVLLDLLRLVGLEVLVGLLVVGRELLAVLAPPGRLLALLAPPLLGPQLVAVLPRGQLRGRHPGGSGELVGDDTEMK